ncbi:hypothetical protein [Turicibacter sanguinis]|uniref:hypothetical protein n=1 Tax=Turicibacter sanguinis TaxID=154288 RepID=UPI0018A972E6|nr:hypothetical protein [Turicibacter sanguinis]MDB8550938.1 hypothetical protein [Turicibacter sanguinis]
MKKLTPSKILSSMALATVLVAATGTPSAQANFQHNLPNNSQLGGSQSGLGGANPQDITGQIEINGTFNKTVSNIPTPTQDGKYLIVTMPLSMNYTYDADSDTLTGSTGQIENRSVKVDSQQPTYQPIIMRVVDLVKGAHTTNAEVKFISTPDTADAATIQVPLQLSLSGASVTNQVIHFANIKSNLIGNIDIAANTNVKMDIEEIPGQKVYNTHLIDQNTAVAKHDLKFEFEYNGQ